MTWLGRWGTLRRRRGHEEEGEGGEEGGKV